MRRKLPSRGEVAVFATVVPLPGRQVEARLSSCFCLYGSLDSRHRLNALHYLALSDCEWEREVERTVIKYRHWWETKAVAGTVPLLKGANVAAETVIALSTLGLSSYASLCDRSA